MLSQDKWIVRTAVGILGKALSEASCAIIYLYTAELYPTVVRLVNSKPTHRLSPRCLRTLLLSTIVHIISVFCFVFLQTEWFRLRFVRGVAHGVRISFHRATGGRVASPSRSHLLCSGAWIRFVGVAPARDAERQAAGDHRRY